MKPHKNILIIGAGVAGRILEADILKHHPQCKVIGFVDDMYPKNPETLGKIHDLGRLSELYKISEAIIAIPSADGQLIRKILLSNLNNRVPIRIIPRDPSIISRNEVRYADVRSIGFEDFLGRSLFKSNISKLKKFYRGKTVLVTGGAGSIGSEIVRQLLDLAVKKVIIYDKSELLTFTLAQELHERRVPRPLYQMIIGDILNVVKFKEVLKSIKPDIIFHAAAYKHVALMEENVDEAIRVNSLGTKHVMDTALACGIPRFIFISTDKAVNPTSVMGASKKLSEYYIRSLNGKPTKKFIVRFGNVINSHGSVFPLFERQIRENQYVTVTHKKMRRFFMSIHEAAQLVISSATQKADDSIHVLNMGELINVYEAALCFIRSKDLIPENDVAIRIIGRKKGEKMTEELFTENEKGNLVKTGIENVLSVRNLERCPVDTAEMFERLRKLTSDFSAKEKAREYLESLFPTLVGRYG